MASQRTSTWCPKVVKSEGLLVEEAGNEVVVYNLEDHRVHCLNEQAVRVWRLCNGKRTVKQIAAEFNIGLNPVSRAIVVQNAISELESLGLVDAFSGRSTHISRREMARKIGIGAVAAVALPLITSIVAPTPAEADSCLPKNTACTLNSQCCSGSCNMSSHKCSP